MSNPWCARAILAAYLAWSRSWILEKVGSRWSLKLQPPRTEERTGARTRTGASITGVVPSNVPQQLSGECGSVVRTQDTRSPPNWLSCCALRRARTHATPGPVVVLPTVSVTPHLKFTICGCTVVVVVVDLYLVSYLILYALCIHMLD